MYIFRFFILAFVFFLSGFKYKTSTHGYVDSGLLVEKGFVQEQVVHVMGRPSVVSDLTGNWYYIRTIDTKSFLGFKKEFSAKIVEINFKEGKVDLIRHSKVSKRPIPNINPDSTVVYKETLEMKIIRALKGLNPSL